MRSMSVRAKLTTARRCRLLSPRGLPRGEHRPLCCSVCCCAGVRLQPPSPDRRSTLLRSRMHPAQRLTVAVRLCALVHEGVAVLQELHRRLLDVLDSLAGRHGCRGTELRENLPREERHDRSNATCLVQAGPIEVEAMVLWCPRVLPPRSRTWLWPDLVRNDLYLGEKVPRLPPFFNSIASLPSPKRV